MQKARFRKVVGRQAPWDTSNTVAMKWSAEGCGGAGVEEGEETGVVLVDCGSVMVDFVSRALSLN